MEQQKEEIKQQRISWKDWQQRIDQATKEGLIFLDESSVDNVTFFRHHGRAYEGRRVRARFPKAKKDRVTVIVAIGWEGILAFLVIPGSATAADFNFFMMNCLAPVIENQHRTIIMDNARIHHSATEAQVSLEALGHKWVFLPPYSPDLNPAENVFSKLKRVLTYFRFSLVRKPALCISEALSLIHAADVQGWYSLCGYK